MTNTQALIASIFYPVDETKAEFALINRGIVAGDNYVVGTMNFELAKADCLWALSCAPNVSEGGYSVSLSDRKMMQQAASAIYSRYNVKNPALPQVKDASSGW